VKAPEMSVATQKETAHSETPLPFLFTWLLGDDIKAVKIEIFYKPAGRKAKKKHQLMSQSNKTIFIKPQST
jgi:hypothetical protein